MIDIVRELTGAAMITVPSSEKDFMNPEASADIERYYVSSEMTARNRVKLMRLAWILLGQSSETAISNMRNSMAVPRIS